MIRVGIQAPSRADFQAQVVASIPDRVPPKAIVMDEQGNPDMRSQNWGSQTRDGTPAWVAYGETFNFVQVPATYDAEGNVITPAVLYSGYCLIIEGDESLLGYEWNPVTEEWENTGEVVPPLWEQPGLLDQLTR